MAIKKLFPVVVLINILLFIQTVYTQNHINIRSGMITIIRPDGMIIPLGKDSTIPKIISGSVINVIEGSVEIVVSEGYIKVAAADSVAMAREGNILIASINPESQTVSFHSIRGNFDIITGNLKTSLTEMQKVAIGLDKYTGLLKIISISGDVVSYIGGARVQMKQNSSSQIRIDYLNNNITIESTAGSIDILSVYGKTYRVNKDESVTILGIIEKPEFDKQKTLAEAAAEGYVTVEEAAQKAEPQEIAAGDESEPEAEPEPGDDLFYFVNLPAEEPPEPEIAEASPYLP